MQIANTLPELIGNTPLLRLERFAPGAGVLAKLESFNPLSSAKDRAGLYMILDAEERGLLQPGAVIVEPTSGNTGVALAYIGRQRGYRVVLTMPETMSQERRSLLAALGAELVLTEGARGMGGAIERAKELLESTPGAWMPDQFNNPANARAHYETTGPELWRDTDGGVDVLVATPGRLLDLEHQNAVKLDNIEILVLEEADRMLDMGFIHDIRRVLAKLPTRRQNLLFSATFSDEIKALAETLLHNPLEVEVARRNTASEQVTQHVHFVDKKRKRELLSQMIGQGNWQQVLVFTRT